MLAIWSLVPLPFLNPACTSGSSRFRYYWSVAWRILSITSITIFGEGNGNSLQCSCLENPRDGGVWWAAVYGVAQSRTRLKKLSGSSGSITFLACEMSATVWQFEHSFALPFYGIGMKTDFFQSYGHCWVFQICIVSAEPWANQCIFLMEMCLKLC